MVGSLSSETNKNFSPVSIGGIRGFHFPTLKNYLSVQHIFTHRKAFGGNDFNLSYAVEEDKENVTQNREKLAMALGYRKSDLVFPQQVHSNKVNILNSNHFNFNDEALSDYNSGTDGLITNVPGKAIAILAADCVPILFYDFENKVIAASHAGWRGTIKEIATMTINKMKSHFHSQVKNIVACIGPSISWQNYEVGEEVVQEFREIFGDSKYVIFKRGKKYHLDLWQANKLLLIDSGLLEKNINISYLCSYNNTDLFFSARKEGFNTGRFAAVIGLKPNGMA